MAREGTVEEWLLLVNLELIVEFKFCGCRAIIIIIVVAAIIIIIIIIIIIGLQMGCQPGGSINTIQHNK
jgi:hypothetical protein